MRKNNVPVNRRKTVEMEWNPYTKRWVKVGGTAHNYLQQKLMSEGLFRDEMKPREIPQEPQYDRMPVKLRKRKKRKPAKRIPVQQPVYEEDNFDYELSSDSEEEEDENYY
jgi:hypothetical protein